MQLGRIRPSRSPVGHANRSRIVVLKLICVACLAVGAGCAPRGLMEAVRDRADRAGVRDAGARHVQCHEDLRFNEALVSDLDDVLALHDLTQMKTNGTAVLEAAGQLAVRTNEEEIQRMPEADVRLLTARITATQPAVADENPRRILTAAFADAAGIELASDIGRLNAASSVNSARGFLNSIRNAIEPAVGDQGKVGRVLLAAPLFIPATIGAEIADAEAAGRAVVADFEHVVRYEPAGVTTAPAAASAVESADIDTLARWYAPVFIQQLDPSAEYDSTNDMIGRVFLTGDAGAVHVNVDTAKPTVYWSTGRAKVGERRYLQLVYVAWYPARPALTSNDSSAGNVDGVVVRLTLDRHHRPAVYEFVRSCGCYHTIWVAEFVEAQARAAFGQPSGRSQFAVQRPETSKQLFMPCLVRDDGIRPRRPDAYVSAGSHMVMEIHPSGASPVARHSKKSRDYQLEPYQDLTRLPLGGGVASMFGKDGLVHNAGRAEGWLLAPTGMLSAGQPRQLGTMKIRMDAYDYDDPRLLERNLRLPDGF